MPDDKFFIQQDEQWKDFEIIKGVTIGEFGCLVTSLTNILNMLGMDFTPLTLVQKIQENNGFDSNGNLSWVVANKIFGLSEVKYLPTDKIEWSNSEKIFYICVLHFQGTGHFCNLLTVQNGIIYYFDVWDGKKKQVALENVLSIREVRKV
jgi:hypothetical protein